MKLIFCPLCQDMRKIHSELTTCRCGKSSGRYLADGRSAEISGSAVAVGIDNHTFGRAFRERNRVYEEELELNEKSALDFVAFIIPFNSPRVKRVP